MKKSDIQWYEVVIPDDSALSGKSMSALLELVRNMLGIRFVVVDGISGANIVELQDNYAGMLCDIRGVIDSLKNVVQLDWCDFFLFESDGVLPGQDQAYDEIIEKTTATVRAVDDEYIYVYTKSENLVGDLCARYSGKEGFEKNVGLLEEFQYPE